MASSVLHTTLWKLHSWLKTHQLDTVEASNASEELMMSILSLSTNNVESILHVLKNLLIFRELDIPAEITGLIDECIDFTLTSAYIEMNAVPTTAV